MPHDCEGPSGALGSRSEPKNGQKMLQIITYFVVHLSNECFPKAKSPYSKIFCLKFSWYTRVSIGNHWEPLRVRKWLKNPSNYQIFLLTPFQESNTVSLWWNHPVVNHFILTSYVTLGSPLRTIKDPVRPFVAPQSLETAKTLLRLSDNPLSTFHLSHTQPGPSRGLFTLYKV